MEDNRKHIEGLFESDGIKAPESLSEENMLAMLEAHDAKADGSEKEFRDAKPRRFKGSARKIMSIAAALIVAVAGIGGYTAIMNTPPDTSLSKNGELFEFENESQIKRLVNSINRGPLLKSLGSNDVYEEDVDLATGDGTVMDAESSDAAVGDAPSANAAESSSSSKSELSSGSHSSTYLQVESVDEADIVKTDGKYIYYVNKDREVVIMSAKDGETRKLSTIGSSGVENYIDDIYIKGDTLITVGQFYRDGTDESNSGIVIYDISDRRDPVYVTDFSQSGSILSSRMVGDYVYLVTNDYVYKGGRLLPMCGSRDDYSRMNVSDICCVPDPQTSSYIILSGIDVSSGAQGKSATKAVLGASSDIYCNDHNLYSASWEYDSDASTSYTRIVRAALDGIDVRFNATTRVPGDVYGQFAMDERNGYFRIATTSQRAGMDVNNLYVLDSDLKETGKVTGFARNESIKAVRFVGSKAYVITYEAIDPLFIIDLSDPSSPKIEGEVMIDGFSTLLVPISEDRLLGIGHATGDNGYGGEYDSGLKLALFDISDPSQPKVLASKEFEDMSSPAQSDHHALTVNSEKGWFAIPYEEYKSVVTEDTDDEYLDSHFENGVLVFRADDSLGSIDKHELKDGAYIYRNVYIGDWIYALDGDGEVQSFKPAVYPY